MMAGMARQPLTTAQVARILHCTTRNVSRMIKVGEIKPQMQLGGVNGAYLFAPTEVDRVVRAQRARIERRIRAESDREGNGTAA